MITQYEGVPLMKIDNITLADFYNKIKSDDEIGTSRYRYGFENNDESFTTENVRRIPGLGVKGTLEVFELAEKMGYKVLKLKLVYV